MGLTICCRLRPTWHFVAPADIHWMLALTAPRVHALNALHYRTLELDQPLLARCHAALAGALRGGNQLTREELWAALERAGIAVGSGMRRWPSWCGATSTATGRPPPTIALGGPG
ncbi:MAG TPA: crosslink repair DNA glycosylase YcaQ family protein [Roseiflexaceae bacterium]|nr:crosslink repair DNA glycosylase YcaQ family protein [Roseiflexaceae bacterium]